MGIFDRLKNRERTPQEQDAPGTGSPFMPPEGAPMGGPPASYQQVTGKLNLCPNWDILHITRSCIWVKYFY